MQDLKAELDKFDRACSQHQTDGFGKYALIMSALFVHSVLQAALKDPGKDFSIPLRETLGLQSRLLQARPSLEPMFDGSSASAGSRVLADGDRAESLKKLYEQAWTVYSQSTYEHSVTLIVDRLRANGFDESYFKNKVCIDSGCGTARFAVAMARLGAKKVIAADLGQESLDFARSMISDLKVQNVELKKIDITDLSEFTDGYFDFVVSNGVLHHTVEQERGLREHLRVTRSGGTMWLYLYGAGGVYFDVYDVLKKHLNAISSVEIRKILLEFGIREGGVYSFLDMLAPIRTYYTREKVKQILEPVGPFRTSILKGTNVIDDTEKLLAASFGAALMGPEGEIRLRIDKV
jgi:ubiquinone/menaquinone biosynthesis C-methylase UbiE